MFAAVCNSQRLLQSGIKKHYLQVHHRLPKAKDFKKALLRDDQVEILTFEDIRREWAARHPRGRGGRRRRQSVDRPDDEVQVSNFSIHY